MKCPKCNTPVEKGDIFCQVCGAPLNRKASRLPIILISTLMLVIVTGGLFVWLFYGEEKEVSSKNTAEVEDRKGKTEGTDIKNTQSGEKTSKEYDIDCTVPGAFQIEGRIEQEGDSYYLEFTEGTKDLLVKKDGGEETVMKDRDKVKIESQEVLISYNGRSVRANGELILDSEENLLLQTKEIITLDTYTADEGGIHRYEYIVSDCTWQQAYQDCISRGGYLARINSQQEYNYILGEISQKGLGKKHFRIGGRREGDSKDYYWVNDKEQLYGDKINAPEYWCAGEWMANEPSFADGNTQEPCLDIFYYDKEGRWVWNDVPDNIIQSVPEYSGKIGYICEYED